MKLTVYVPDELGARIKEIPGVNISALLQRAIKEFLGQITEQPSEIHPQILRAEIATLTTQRNHWRREAHRHADEKSDIKDKLELAHKEIALLRTQLSRGE